MALDPVGQGPPLQVVLQAPLPQQRRQLPLQSAVVRADLQAIHKSRDSRFAITGRQQFSGPLAVSLGLPPATLLLGLRPQPGQHLVRCPTGMVGIRLLLHQPPGVTGLFKTLQLHQRPSPVVLQPWGSIPLLQRQIHQRQRKLSLIRLPSRDGLFQERVFKSR